MQTPWLCACASSCGDVPNQGMPSSLQGWLRPERVGWEPKRQVTAGTQGRSMRQPCQHQCVALGTPAQSQAKRGDAPSHTLRLDDTDVPRGQRHLTVVAHQFPPL